MSFPWHEIRNRLMQSSATLSFQRRFEAIRRSAPALSPFRDPPAVLEALRCNAVISDRKNRILAALVRAAQDDGPTADCALTLMLLALWPGLDAIRRRLIWRQITNPDELAADILARTTETIRGLDLGRVDRIAATVLRNVERDLIRARRREANRQSDVCDLSPERIAADHDPPDYAGLKAELQRVIGPDAALLLRIAVEGFSRSEVATELGLSEATVRKRYQRASQRLGQALEKKF